jgi:uncharacterized membrane protein
MRYVKLVSKVLLTVLFVGSGVLHFVNSDFFMKIMPPYLPWHLELVYLSGAIEIILGVGLWIPGLSRAAAWGLIALLVAVFPANIYGFQHQELVPAPPLLHILRLPLQLVFIAWAYWHTRPDPAPPSASKSSPG